jgi:hypothetical protein
MKANNIVQSWLEVELFENGKILAEALEDLNYALNTAYTHSRVREWEENRNGRGERLPREVRIYMGRIVARSVLDSAGFNTKKLSQRQINQLVENFC